jgi:hypothetical protein
MWVLLHIINITLITIVPSHDNKFVKSYKFDLIFITEYLIQLLKMHLTIIIIIVFLVTSQFLELGGLRPVIYISGGLSSLNPPSDFRLWRHTFIFSFYPPFFKVFFYSNYIYSIIFI